MMCKKDSVNTKEDLPHLKDHLCHIFQYRSLTYCLVCCLDISKEYLFSSNFISDHLTSSDHEENFKSLFKMCIPDACDSEECLDIVKNSVFDISVLLQEETCYISVKKDSIVCLMCSKMRIAKCNNYSTKFVKNIIAQHVQSKLHLCFVRDVCWVYRLKTKNDYVLFYKSVVYCSMCDTKLNCEESKLLHTVIHHLQSVDHRIQNVDNVQYSPDVNTVCVRSETLVKWEYSAVEHGNVVNYKDESKSKNICNIPNEIRSQHDLVVSPIRLCSFFINVPFNYFREGSYLCPFCKVPIGICGNVKSSVFEHCMSLHHNELENCIHKEIESIQEDLDVWCSKIDLYFRKMKIRSPVFFQNLKFITVIGIDGLLCNICWHYVSSSEEDDLISRMFDHLVCKAHIKVTAGLRSEQKLLIRRVLNQKKKFFMTYTQIMKDPLMVILFTKKQRGERRRQRAKKRRLLKKREEKENHMHQSKNKKESHICGNHKEQKKFLITKQL